MSKLQVTPQEAEQLFTEVLKEFGVLLDFKIVKSNEPASFTWGLVQLPIFYLEKYPANIVKQVLRHEVGHRVVFPGKPDWEKLTMIIAARKGVTDTETFANVVADLIVDYEMMKKFGQEYYERIVVAANNYRGKDPRFWYMLAVYQLMAEDLKIKTPDFIERARKYSIKPDMVVEKAKKTLGILKSNASLEGKIEQLAELLKDLFHIMYRHSFDEKIKSHGGVPNLSRLGPMIPAPEFMVQNDKKNPVRDPQWLSHMIALLVKKVTQCHDKNLCKPTNRPAFLMQLGIGYTGEIMFMDSDVIIEAARLSLYSRYVEALEKVGASGTKVEELEQWTLGDLPYELRVEETMRIYGEVLPPIFSLKFSTKEEPIEGGKGGSVIIVVDVSGSMAGLKLERAKEAAFSILQEARKRGDEVLLIFFNGRALALPPGREYDVYEKAIAAVLATGGTILPRALEYAVEYAAKVGRATTFIITDAETGEVRYTMRLMNELAKYGKTVVFWITSGGSYVAEELLKNVEAKVYIVHPGERFTEEALREAQW
ncbi:MAG: hypothetical protein DRJ18_00990 [Candidatus Methanomethylicota archaeon]|nr:MAG: hypothetical protein DRJ18_00990 [Candidatus Verstraetearchaeota archaeon]